MVVERQSSMQSGSGGGSLWRPRRGDAYRQVSYGRREVGRPAKHAGSGYESAQLEARTGAKLVGKPVAVPNLFYYCLSSRRRSLCGGDPYRVNKSARSHPVYPYTTRISVCR